MICLHQFAVLDCQRWEEVRFVATSLCSKVGRTTTCCHQLAVLDCQRCEKARFVATSLRCSVVKDGKKYDLLPPVCARVSKMGRSTICCHEFALDCQRWEKVRFIHNSLCSKPPVCAERWEEVRFVATSLCSIVKDGKKYDLLPPVCGARLSKIGRSTICCHQFVLKDGKKYDWLPPVCGARLSKMGRSTICCYQFVLDCQRWEEVRFVATSLRWEEVTICCYQFVLDCQRWEVRSVATSLRCSIVKDGKKYDLLPPVCARVSKMGSPTCCHQLVLDCQRREEVCFVATSLCSKMGKVRFAATSFC